MPENRQKLLLHICCGPCSTSVIERLKEKYDVTGYFYNPNIQPEEEYRKRLKSLEHFFTFINLPLVVDIYDPGEWHSLAAGLENEPEGGKRCKICFAVRLQKALTYGSEHGFQLITTTLTVSPLKNAGEINKIGNNAVDNFNIGRENSHPGSPPLTFLEADFKKKNGYQRSIELSKKYDLYRQNYCGCIFSKRD